MTENTWAALNDITAQARACTICADFLPLGPRPVFQLGTSARILIAGQAPGRKVHETGVPFDDPSGERLRAWMGIDKAVFYDPSKIAILPMGFCYPGTGKSGDLPPRPECAVAWRDRLLKQLPSIELTLVIGRYAIDWHMNIDASQSLTETVQNWKRVWPSQLPLPHPSPRNNIWLKKNAWFESEILPELKERIRTILNSGTL